MSRLTRFLRSLCMPRVQSFGGDLPPIDPAGMREELKPPHVLPLHGYHPPLQQPGFPVAVCWSAKSGCTTVLKWFLTQNGLLDEALAYNDWVHAYRQDKLFAASDYLRECNALFKNSDRNTAIIKVIRDPTTRAVSSFLHFLRYGHDIKRWFNGASLTDWKSVVGIEHQEGLSFRQFLAYVTAQQHKGLPLDPHFHPQYDSQQDPMVDTYIRLEDLSCGLRAVEARYGLPHVDVENLSVSDHHNPAKKDHAWPVNAATVPADQRTLVELGTPPANVFFDPETLSLIRAAYWTDYEAYGHHYDTASAMDLHIGERQAA